jgi:hypothetical protein
MTPLETCDAIERFLREHLGKLKLPSPEGGETPLNFYQMNLPQPGAQAMRPRQEDEEGNEIEQGDDDIPLDDGGYTRNEARRIFPAVVIRPVKFSGASEGDLWGELTVVVSVGVFDESDECADGLKWVTNILERTRQLLEKNRLLEKRCKVVLPLTYELYDESVRPYWFGEMVTEWRIPVQYEDIELDGDYRGANYPSGNGIYPRQAKE